MIGAPPTKHELLGGMSDIIRTVDEHARELNRRWGMNRLPHLVPVEWTERFVRQKAKWEAACFDCSGSPMPEHLAEVRKHGEAMLRAFDKLEELALAAKHSPAPAQVWEFELKDGTQAVLVRTTAEMAQIESKAQVWSLEEVAAIIARYPELVLAKEAFPQVEVVRLATSPVIVDELNDSLADIPWD